MRAIYDTKGRAKEFCEKAINLYSTCGHLCTYCYGADVTHQAHGQFFRDAAPRAGILRQIERDARMMQARGERGPVLMCFVTDPYQPVEREYRVTREAIELLHQHNVRATILTKAGPLAQRDFDLLGPDDAFATTLTCLTSEQAAPWEPNAGSPESRMANLHEAHQRGIETWVSCEPVIDPEWTKELVWKTHDDVGLFKVGTMNYHEHGKTINWRRFGNEIKSLLEEIGVPYYLKKDLRREMGIL